MDDTSQAPVYPQGTGYGRPAPQSDVLLTQVGPGTPCGELMRRYWHPVLAAEHVTNRPQEVRILGEDLVIFRDGNGNPGLLYPHCSHRGASLFWGHVEPDGIRCCYHGWKFDVEGNCLEQPCEPMGGVNKAAHRQPWYPVREHYGLVWTYMGPPDKMPLLPRFDNMEPLVDDEFYWTSDNSLSAHADLNGPAILPYSWLHMNDNCMDPFHAQVLHSTFSGAQFVREFAVMPKLKFEPFERGVIYKAERRLDDGRVLVRVNTWLAPNITSVPGLGLEPGPSDRLTIFVPVDDTHCRTFVTRRQKKDDPSVFSGAAFANMKPWSQMTVAERQDAPGDYEAQSSQGALQRHSEEHLVTSDRGIGMQRRFLRQQIERVAAGEDPVGAAFAPGEDMVHVPSGNFFV